MTHPTSGENWRAWPFSGFAVLLTLGLAAMAGDFALLAAGKGDFAGACRQHDFITYYYAAKAIALGISPYDIEAIARATGEQVLYVYTWFMTAPFRLLLDFDFESARLIFVAAKLLASAALALLGWRLWVGNGARLAWAAFFICGLNGAWMLDMCLGNVVVFEALALWAALLALLRGRLFWFAALVALASLNKIVYLGFLPLAPLLYPGRRNAWLWPAAIVLCLTLLAALCWFLEPALSAQWLRNLRPVPGLRYNWLNIAKLALGFTKEVEGALPLWQRLDFYIYLAISTGFWAGAALAYLKSARHGATDRALGIVALYTLAFAATVPFAFSYSWVYTLGAVFVVLTQALRRGGAWSIAGLAIAALALVPLRAWLLVYPGWSFSFIHLAVVSAAAVLSMALLACEDRSAQRRT